MSTASGTDTPRQERVAYRQIALNGDGHGDINGGRLGTHADGVGPGNLKDKVVHNHLGCLLSKGNQAITRKT